MKCLSCENKTNYLDSFCDECQEVFDDLSYDKVTSESYYIQGGLKDLFRKNKLKKIDEIKQNKLNGVSPDFVVVDTSLNVKNPKYWCVIELVNIQGEVRTEHHEDIDLQDFEILYGGITDNILSIDLQRMPVQVMEVEK